MKKSVITLALTSLVCGAALAGAAKPDAEISKANWLSPEVNQWTFQNSSQILPSAVVSRGDNPVAKFSYAPMDIIGLAFDGIVDGKRQKLTVADYLLESNTDAMIVLHQGKIVAEHYFNGMEPLQRHIVMSVTKSFVGTLTTQLIAEGKLDEQATVDSILPEYQGTDLGKATVRQVLDMTTGMAYSEDYANPEADVWQYLSAIGLIPRSEGYQGPRVIRDYLKTMKQHVPAGQQFEYITPMSEMLQALVVAAEGKPFEQVMSERLWQKLGVEKDALILVEDSQQALAGSGLQMTARDMARFGQMMLNQGQFNGQQILDPAVVADIAKGGDKEAFAEYGKHSGMGEMSYRGQWWHTENAHKAYSAMGVFGQYIYIDPAAEVVIVKQSSDREAVTDYSANNDFLMMHAVANFVSKK